MVYLQVYTLVFSLNSSDWRAVRGLYHISRAPNHKPAGGSDSELRKRAIRFGFPSGVDHLKFE